MARRAPLPFVDPGGQPPSAQVLPSALWTLATHLSTRPLMPDFPTYASSSSALVRGGLYGRLRPRLIEVRSAHPGKTDRDDALGLVYRLAVIVGSSLVPLETPAGGGMNAMRTAWSSVRTLRRGFLEPLEAARVALDGAPGVCRDFAAALQTLFWLVQTETGAFPDARLVCAVGRSDFSRDVGHAWTWLFEKNRRHVVSLDLMRAAGAKRAGQAPHVLTRAIAGAQHNNMSSMVASLFGCVEHPQGVPKSVVRAAMSFARELQGPGEPAGAELLFRVLRQRGLGPDVQALGRTALEKGRFDAKRPDWRGVLDADARYALGSLRYPDTKRRVRLMKALLR